MSDADVVREAVLGCASGGFKSWAEVAAHMREAGFTFPGDTPQPDERKATAAALYRLEWDADLYTTPRSRATERYERRADRLLAAGFRRTLQPRTDTDLRKRLRDAVCFCGHHLLSHHDVCRVCDHRKDDACGRDQIDVLIDALVASGFVVDPAEVRFTADEVVAMADETSDSLGNLYRLDFIDRVRHEAGTDRATSVPTDAPV